MFGKSTALLAAMSLAASPAFAQASSLSIGPAIAESSGEASNLEGGSVVPMILFAAIVLGGVLLAVGVFDDERDPVSP